MKNLLYGQNVVSEWVLKLSSYLKKTTENHTTKANCKRSRFGMPRVEFVRILFIFKHLLRKRIHNMIVTVSEIK